MGLKKPNLELPANHNGIALDYGTVMHKVLPTMYTGDVKIPIETFKELWAKYAYGEEDPKRNTSVTMSRIIDFVRLHTPQNCPYEIQHYDFASPSELISENEIPFLIDIGAEHLLAGRIDEVVRLKATDSIWAYDFKTSSEISDRYYNNFWNAPQVVGYTIALSQIIGESVDGLILEVMRISKTNIETQYREIDVSAVNIKTFIDEAKLNCARIDAANETGMWRQNTALCSSYSSFGMPGFTCEYRSICDSLDWKDGARFFERTKPFNPLEIE
jgi:hypothetical protein